jgi:hypothetical protein
MRNKSGIATAEWAVSWSFGLPSVRELFRTRENTKCIRPPETDHKCFARARDPANSLRADLF